MPKKLIENSNVLKLVELPYLRPSVRNKIATKHLFNCSLYLSFNNISLLYWLVYHSKADNSFIYNQYMIDLYVSSIKGARDYYKGVKGVNLDFKEVRKSFLELIENGYLLPCSEVGVFIVNPMLVYHSKYLTRKKYLELEDRYRGLRIDNIKEFSDYYRLIIKK